MTNNIASALFILGLFFLGAMVFDKVLKKIAGRYDASASESFRLISNSQKAVLIFIGCVLALSKLGFDVSALVAGLGLTGFAMGLALKDAISNLVAGIMIVVYKPIQLGDRVELAGVKGAVVDLNLRYITVRAEDVVHLVPNSLLLNSKVSLMEDKPEVGIATDSDTAAS
ncbi:mechanosensitive ion channel [Aestuariicella hydrocarbonica]|uniref:Small-conductance mechanosensitive channel n=1 Tax=Pseudomaricurvus hydrocarbonicus TaxID=1470433 RepID=A0A9E5T2E7_9GAMM|nr:mechanosensitive ion channel domain-containing protein [Aestuariicella hydrocarbonica]NHO68370.1 mechanosensitive ion channel [Aestuariicella hydrocarbonica]